MFRKNKQLNEKGSVIVITALMLTVLLGFTGLAIDVGNIYWEKTKIQTAVDAAALGGAQELPNTSQAQYQAQQYISNNDESPANATITFANNNNRINVSLIKNIPTYFMGLLGIRTVKVTTTAAALLNGPGGPFDYAIFSGSQTVSLPINGSNYMINGSVHTNHNLIINGYGMNITGTAEAVGTITINGSCINVGSKQSSSSVVDMPDYSSLIASSAAAVNQVYTGTRTINGSGITTDPIYVKGYPGTVVVNGSGFTANGAVLADGSITINGSGSASGDSQVCFYSKNGDIVLNGSSLGFHGVLYAPNGRVIVNGSSLNVQGSVVANQVILNGSDYTINRTDNPITSIPVRNVKLIQ